MCVGTRTLKKIYGTTKRHHLGRWLRHPSQPCDPGRQQAADAGVRKLEAELGWTPAETFETGIRKTVEWYLANPEWVANVQSGAYKDWVSKQYEGVKA